MTKQLTRRGFVGGTVATAGLLGVTAAANVAANTFGAAIDSKLGRGAVTVTKTAGTEHWDSQYYKTTTSSLAEAKQASDLVSEQVTDEGIVLLKNDGVLPLAANAEVTPFGWAYSNAAYSGTGAAASTDDTMVTADAAISAKFKVNRAALDLTASAEAVYPDAADGTNPLDFDTNSIQAQMDAGENAKIYEYDASVYANLTGAAGTALVVIKRCGSEGIDKRYEAYNDGTPHYLAFTKNERETIRAAKAACGSVVVVLNSANPMELAPIMDGDLEANAILWIGTAGSRGFSSLAKVLAGEVNPSGRLTDIYATDFTADPTYKNFGRFDYTNSEVACPDLTGLLSGGSIGSKTQARHFVEYQEGVYEGYRYYETAASVDPSFTYGELDGQGGVKVAGAVAYPFGYGLSYTTFDQAITAFDASGDTVSATVTVTNTGATAGKEVVQLYFSAPYTDLDRADAVEKPACVLAAFAKTSLLEPGASEAVQLSFAREDMASYDYNHENSNGTTGCYVLEAGDYEVTLRANSHDVLDARTVTVSTDTWYDEKNPRATEIDGQSTHDDQGVSTGTTFDGSAVVAATNQLETLNAYMRTPGVTMLSRADWTGTQPTGYDGRTKEAPQVALEEFDWFDNFDPATDSKLGNVEGSQVFAAQAPTSRAANGISLIDLRGVEYDDERWDLLLDQVDWDGEKDNLIALLFGAAYQTKDVTSVGKPATTDADGAMGWSLDGASSWAAANIQASTWNVDLMHQLGSCIGEEALHLGLTGWYAPAVNIHRSPFSGRVYEYYSEDPLVSGKIAAGAIAGAADKGCISYLKHYALNDQETDRSNYIATWVNEQAAREVYLKAFEVAVKEAKTQVAYISDDNGTVSTRTIRATTGIMSSQNSIGGIMGFCHRGTQQGILRNEWGFSGAVITDLYIGGPAKDSDLVVRTGGNMYMSMMGGACVDYDSATARAAMRNALHGVLYATANSNAMNGVVPGASISYATSPWRVALYAASGLAVAGAAAIVGRMAWKKTHGTADDEVAGATDSAADDSKAEKTA